MLSARIDLNCDMGEGMTTDGDIFPFISSANIACGYHAGDTDTMRRTIGLALQHGVAVGAHPSYPDRTHFGRQDILESGEGKRDGLLRLNELPDLLLDQLDQLQSICRAMGTTLHHVKPHGALYNRAAKDPVVSALICRTILQFDPSLLLYGLSGSETGKEAARLGLSFVAEAFADRGYQADGSLIPRTQPGALIEDPGIAVAQVLQIVRQGHVGAVPVHAETICIHGDGVDAVRFAQAIREGLMGSGIQVAAPATGYPAEGS
jgi:UPF0271 protein